MMDSKRIADGYNMLVKYLYFREQSFLTGREAPVCDCGAPIFLRKNVGPFDKWTLPHINKKLGPYLDHAK